MPSPQSLGTPQASKLLLSAGYAGFSASRTYYAMFYLAKAFLAGEGLSFSKHSAVISAFGHQFAKTGKVPAEFHRFLMEAQDLRFSGDYEEGDVVKAGEAQEQIEHAERFLEMARQRIG
jgi:uncharacterized protein (UPF0332 family)